MKEQDRPMRPAKPPPCQADDDEQVIELWLNNVVPETRKTYKREIIRFIQTVQRPLRNITVGDVQMFLAGLSRSSATRAKVLASIRALFRFAIQIGYVEFSPASVVHYPTVQRRLAERLLSEEQVHRVIAAESDPRNRLILETLYLAGLRVSELTGLRWGDIQERHDLGTAQARVVGKRGRERMVPLPPRLWQQLRFLRNGLPDSAPVFISRKGQGPLDRSQILRIVKNAVKEAGIKGAISPHWFRHAHATHAIQHGAPLHVVQQTLGHSSLAVTGIYLHARPMESSSLYLDIGSEDLPEKPARS